MFQSNSISSMSIIIVVFLTIYANNINALESATSHRSRRQLLFPNSTLLQFNAGVGTPTPIKTILVNWAFQANFQLPWNRTQIPLDILYANSGYDGDARGKRDVNIENKAEDKREKTGEYENDARLYHLYKYVEDILNGFGHNGTTCVLRAMCQLGAEPLFSDDKEDLLHEIATFVLNPTNDVINDPVQDKDADAYVAAYNRGQKSENCLSIYSPCSISVVDMFTKLDDS